MKHIQRGGDGYWAGTLCGEIVAAKEATFILRDVTCTPCQTEHKRRERKQVRAAIERERNHANPSQH